MGIFKNPNYIIVIIISLSLSRFCWYLSPKLKTEMGNFFAKTRGSHIHRAKGSRGIRRRNVSSTARTRTVLQSSSPPQPPPAAARLPSGRNMSAEESISEHSSGGQRTVIDRKASAKQKYALIPDNFTTLEQVSCSFFLYMPFL